MPLGQIHNEVRHDLLVSDAKQLAAHIDAPIDPAIVAANKGNVDVSRMPRFVFDTQLPEDLTVYSDSLPKLVEIGT